MFRANSLALLALLTSVACAPAIGCGEDDWSDDTGPTITWTVPVQGAENVRLGTPVILGFDEELDRDTLVPDNFMIAGSSPGGLSYDSQSSVLTLFQPDPPLDPGTSVDLVVKSTVTDLYGHHMVVLREDGSFEISDFHLEFKLTGDTRGPAVTGTVPEDGATDVATDEAFTAFFDENLDPAVLGHEAVSARCEDDGIELLLEYRPASGADPARLTGIPTGGWPESCEISISISGHVTDSVGNEMGQDFLVEFSTSGR